MNHNSGGFFGFAGGKKPVLGIFPDSTLPETNSSHLKMDGWKTILSFWGKKAYFQGLCLLVSGRVVPFFVGLSKKGLNHSVDDPQSKH